MKSCIACNSNLKFLGENQGVAIYQCPDCGLGATAGEQEEYEAYHRDPVYITEREQFSNIFQKRVDIISRFMKKGKVLEVGSSAGNLLVLLKRRGWEVQGVEPSGSAAKEAEKRAISTLNTTFEEAEFKEGEFDLVIFNHVLEHMEDPKEVLKKVNRILRKGGRVLIDVPNFASLTARVGGAGWRYILPREHRWHFTPTSLFVLLEKAGFAPIYWEAHSGIWGYGKPLAEVVQALKGRKKRFFWDTLTALPTFVLTKLKAGTGLTVVAQKAV